MRPTHHAADGPAPGHAASVKFIRWLRQRVAKVKDTSASLTGLTPGVEMEARVMARSRLISKGRAFRPAGRILNPRFA